VSLIISLGWMPAWMFLDDRDRGHEHACSEPLHDCENVASVMRVSDDGRMVEVACVGCAAEMGWDVIGVEEDWDVED
jgi:hypothetical protein